MQLTSEILKSLRSLLGKSSDDKQLVVDLAGQSGSDYIKELLLADAPCMISRFGSNELDATLRTYERQRNGPLRRILRYVRGDIAAFWWDRSIRKRMSQNAGFFPTDNRSLSEFGKLILDDIRQIDVLGSWRNDEWRLRHLFPEARLVNLIELEPFRHADPWSEALANKKVLVVHPFDQSIRNQFANRTKLFQDQRVLPDFELLTLRAVVSNARNDVDFSSWFDALNYMCRKIEELDFDVALIGAGAYGLPLAAFVKRMGKKAVHLGGATQLLFGIKGQRWDESYQHVYNDFWVRPLPSEVPQRADLVESHAYW